MKNECYGVMFREKLYSDLAQIKADIDQWLIFYNTERTHSGKHCYEITPMHTFKDLKALAKDKELDNLFLVSDSQSNLTK